MLKTFVNTFQTRRRSIMKQPLNEFSLFQLKRNPNEDFDNKDLRLVGLTRERLIQIFPDTDEGLLQEDNILVRHPYLHPKFNTKLISAENLYETLRTDAELEFSESLFKLGASSISLIHTTNKFLANEVNFNAKGHYGAVTAEGSTSLKTSEEDTKSHLWKVTAEKIDLDISTLDEEDFFNEIVYNKQNNSLRLLYNRIKEGQHFKEFRLEFQHKTARSLEFEAKIKAGFSQIWSVELDFKKKHEENEVQTAIFLAEF